MEDEKFTQERYEEIQAKTMWEMTDDVNDGKQRLLFLTNKQAEVLAQPDNISKLMKNGFEFNEPPKLLIDLQWDGNFRRQIAAKRHLLWRDEGGKGEVAATLRSREEIRPLRV